MDLDETNRKILYLLQEENRTNLTHDEIADRIDVSSSTVSNRLAHLKDDDILINFSPVLNYEQIGIPHHLLSVCTAPIFNRQELAEQSIDIHGVVGVRELLTAKRNVHIEVVCMDAVTIEEIATQLDDLGFEIEYSKSHGANTTNLLTVSGRS